MKTIWVFAAGMRRAGSTLQYHLARDLIEHAGGHNAGWITHQKFQKTYNELDGKHPYVILKTHAYIPKFIPVAKELFETGRARALYIYRDLRDVAASLKQFRYSNWKHIVEKEMPAILNEYKEWTRFSQIDSDKQLRVWKYEDFQALMRFTPNKMRGLETFFEMGFHPLAFHWEILNRHSLTNHLKLLQDQLYSERGYNHDSLMWRNHITDGKIGKYITVLTPAELDELYTVPGVVEWLQDKGYINDTRIDTPKNIHRDVSHNT